MQRSSVSPVRQFLALGFVPPPYDGMQTFARMKFLYDAVVCHASSKSGFALELGCYKCCSTVFLSKACIRKGIRAISAIDLFTGTPDWNQKMDTYDAAMKRLRRYGVDQYVNLIRGKTLDVNWSTEIDVLHVDADHRYEAVRNDIQRFLPFVVAGGLIIFDDYDREHPGVQRAVHELLLEGTTEICDVHCRGPNYGSICLRKLTAN